jgi:hypothetical protein
MRRFLGMLVLSGMILHSLGRLGILSYLYVNRHDIAYSLGISAERVISMCRGDYFAKQELKINDDSTQDSAGTIVEAQEIILFYQDVTAWTPLSFQFFLPSPGELFQQKVYSRFPNSIFHPPQV